jgi:uncharacterized protein (TIGR03084 family)
VLHLAQTNEFAIASLEGRVSAPVAAGGRLDGGGAAAGGQGGGLGATLVSATSVDDAAADAVAAERGQPGPVVRDRWRATADELVRRLEQDDLGRRVNWVVGRLSARTLATTRQAETWIHGGDVATAVGRPIPATDRLQHIARLAWRTLPYAFERSGRSLSGPVAFELTGPAGQRWRFGTDEVPATVIRGEAIELCLVAGRRRDPRQTGLAGDGPDVAAVLELVRTYA